MASSFMRSRNLPTCPCCGLPEPACPGLDTPRIVTRTSVIVFVHKLELWKTSNTGRLVSRVLSRCDLRVRGARDCAPEPIAAPRKLLLFPLEGARELRPEDGLTPGTVLIVPDGTWGQARRLARREPLLADTEAVKLPPGASSRYRLRLGAGEGMLSTFEAVARALGVLEGPEIEEAMLEVFDRFVTRMLTARGATAHSTANS